MFGTLEANALFQSNPSINWLLQRNRPRRRRSQLLVAFSLAHDYQPTAMQIEASLHLASLRKE